MITRERIRNAVEYLRYAAKEGYDVPDTISWPTENIVEYAEGLMNRADQQADALRKGD